jgi:hypothetical protein
VSEVRVVAGEVDFTCGGNSLWWAVGGEGEGQHRHHGDYQQNLILECECHCCSLVDYSGGSIGPRDRRDVTETP